MKFIPETRLKKFSVYKREPKSFMLKMSVNTFNKVRSSISSKRITNIFLKKKKKRNALVELFWKK